MHCSILFHVSILFRIVCGSNHAPLHTRTSEHLGIPPITGKYLTNPAISTILSQINASGQPANFDDFQILYESLLINKYKPNISKFKAALFLVLTSSKLSFMSYVFLTSYPSSHSHIFS